MWDLHILTLASSRFFVTLLYGINAVFSELCFIQSWLQGYYFHLMHV